MISHLTRAGHRNFDVVIVNQTNHGLFNKGALFNLGVNTAFARGCDYVALHDVDHLPTDAKNTYMWPSAPIHLCTNSSDVGWERFAGGAVLMQLSHYVLVNGFSNSYNRWVAEDLDLYDRVEKTLGAPIARLDPAVGHYTALDHEKDSFSQRGADGTDSHESNLEQLRRQKDAKDRTVMDGDGYLQMRQHLRVVRTAIAGQVITITAHVLNNGAVQPPCF